MTTTKPHQSDPEALLPHIVLVRPRDRANGEVIINFMNEHRDKLLTKETILKSLGWSESADAHEGFGRAMNAARRIADMHDLHLTFYLWKLGGYVLAAGDVDIAIKAVQTRVRSWSVSAINIGRTGQFINRHAPDPFRKQLGKMLDSMATQAMDNMTQMAKLIQLHEQDVVKREATEAKRESAAAKKAVRQSG